MRPAGVLMQRLASSRALFFCRASGRALAALAALVLVAVTSPNALAGAFAVNPVRVELSAQRSSAVLQVENTGSSEVTVEARTFAWSQSEGKDQLSPTREVIITPQVFRLKAGGTQLLRIGALRKPDPLKEMPYRLVLEEIPPPPAPDIKGLRVALRISIPVFLRPPVDTKDKIDVVARQETPQQLRLIFSNTGNASAVFSKLSVSHTDTPDELLASHGSVIYVLPSQRRELVLDSKAIDLTKNLLIRARTPTGLVNLDAVFETR